MKTISMSTLLAMVLFLFLFLSAGFLNAAENNKMKELAKLSIEELISIKVTSVLKTPQSLDESPAAVYVMTADDIRRSGAMNIPDLLRNIPGVQVAEIEKDIYGVSIRGFNDIHSNKLLVMIDGRSIYNHIFSGVIWTNLNIFINDIDRIEVIRGPGSSVWGANAVNGVINIITKKTDDTKGAFVEFGGGNPRSQSGAVRYGGELGYDAGYRLFASWDAYSADYISQSGYDATGDMNSRMGGFRLDWDLNESNNFAFDGDLSRDDNYIETINPKNPDDNIRDLTIESRHLRGKWNHIFSEGSEMMFQTYYYHEERQNDYSYDTLDIELQHDYEMTARNHMVWGGGYRFTKDEMIKGLFGSYTFEPVKRNLHLFNLFVQDTYQLIPKKLDVTLGTKLEHNDFTGFEFQPGMRLLWTPHEKHTFWGAVSRAVRTPSRVDSDSKSQNGALPSMHLGPDGKPIPPRPGDPMPLSPNITKGDENFNSEDLIAYEIGYRVKPHKDMWIDFALFMNDYSNLSTYIERENSTFYYTNDMEGLTYGYELSIDYRPLKWLSFDASWSLIKMDMHLTDDRAVDFTYYVEETTPKNQFSLHSGVDILKNVELDIWLRHVDEIVLMRGVNETNPSMESTGGYTVFDTRLAWKPTNGVELSVTGRNLGGSHKEFSKYEVEESIYFQVKFDTGNW